MIDIWQYEFFRYAVYGLLIISAVSAMIGTYIVSRRLVSISGGITHACFGGLGLGYFLGISPVFMAAVVAVAASAGVEWMSHRYRVREDSAIAVIWALGMALGILFVFLTPGYVPELNTFLFGNVLTISVSDLLAFAIFALVAALFFALRYKQIVACAFDADFARVMHLPVRFINYTMTVLVAVSIVLTIRLVGIMLLMSLLALPQMIAETWYRRFASGMFASIAVSVACCMAGLFLSVAINVPCSALIVLVMTALFFIVRIIAAVRRSLHRRHNKPLPQSVDL